MMYRGYGSVREYEAEAASHGFKTRRVSVRADNGEGCFLLCTTAQNGRGLTDWALFDNDETRLILTGIYSPDGQEHSLVGGVDINSVGTLAAHGYFPAGDLAQAYYRNWLKSDAFRDFIRKPGKRLWMATWALPYGSPEIEAVKKKLAYYGDKGWTYCGEDVEEQGDE